MYVRSGILGIRGTPLISILVPPFTLTLTSCLAEPIPVRTRPVLRVIRLHRSATSATSNGVLMSGAVTVSISGMPRRSVRYTRLCPASLTSRQESSSIDICTTPTSRPL
ncbi:MAG: hypothetical protein MZU97_07170 [Bacillus subtilis]|nr:hypothetical protein [Bacillus subtilis]